MNRPLPSLGLDGLAWFCFFGDMRLDKCGLAFSNADNSGIEAKSFSNCLVEI